MVSAEHVGTRLPSAISLVPSICYMVLEIRSDSQGDDIFSLFFIHCVDVALTTIVPKMYTADRAVRPELRGTWREN